MSEMKAIEIKKFDQSSHDSFNSKIKDARSFVLSIHQSKSETRRSHCFDKYNEAVLHMSAYLTSLFDIVLSDEQMFDILFVCRDFFELAEWISPPHNKLKMIEMIARIESALYDPEGPSREDVLSELASLKRLTELLIFLPA